jgi:hypothetical protein
MTIYSALQAARTAMNQVTDPADLALLRKDLNEFRKDCKYLEFLEPPFQTHQFKTDSAFVISHVAGNLKKVETRRIQRSDGRTAFGVKTVRLALSLPIPFDDPRFTADEYLENVVKYECRPNLGPMAMEAIQACAFKAMMSAAEYGKHVVEVARGRPAALQAEVERLMDDLGVPSTLIANNLDAGRLRLKPNDYPTERIGQFGTVAANRTISEGVMLIVANKPEDVGFVKIEVEPQLFVDLQNACDALVTTTTRCGFCVWGGAPIIKIDFRQ